MKLTEKQQRFADYYIETGNITDSARRAGYKQPHVQGSQTLENVRVKSYINERLEDLKSKRIADQEEIMMYLSALVRGEHTEQTLRGVGEGAQVIDNIDVSAKDRIKAAELLGKRYAMWTDKQQMDVTGVVQFVDDIDDIDD